MANRRYDRALGLAQRFGGRAVAFDDLPGQLEHADIVVSSTGAPHQIVGREELEFVAASRMGRPLVLIDLAVPRDIEPERARLPRHRPLRHGRPPARGRAQPRACARPRRRRRAALVREEVARFERWLASLDVVPTISALRRRGDEIVEQVLRENESRWESLSEADRERVATLARAVVSRLLHEPTLRLKRCRRRGRLVPRTCTRSASCSGSRRRSRRSRRGPPRSHRSRHAAGAAGA